MNWTANNVYQYENKQLKSQDGITYRWYTDSADHLVLRIDGEFGLMIADAGYNLTDLLREMNQRKLEPKKAS